MERTTLNQIYENWVNGNISTVKRELKALPQVELVDFIAFTLENDTAIVLTLARIRNLLD